MTLLPILAAAGVTGAVDLNSIFGGGIGTLAVLIVGYVGKLVLDRTIPSRSDSRASVSMVLEGLNNMVALLQEEKKADTERLEKKIERIETLELAAERDYMKIKELREEIADLSKRLDTKNRHITELVSQLRRFGAQVTGLDLENITVTQRVLTGPVPIIDTEEKVG